MSKILGNNYIVFLIGALCSLAFAPFHFFPAAIISLSIFYFILEEKESKKEIFWCGFFYGFGYFLSGLYWVAIPLYSGIKQYEILAPFALIIIPSSMALYIAMLASCYKFLLKKFSFHEAYQKILLFALCWLFFEVLRQNFLYSGFPWNLLGYIWLFEPKLTHLAAIFGIYGLSFLAVITCLAPVLFLKKNAVKKSAEIVLGDKILIGFILILLAVSFIYGYSRIDETKLTYEPRVRLRLLKTNVENKELQSKEARHEFLLKQIAMTNSRSLENIDVVVWPETSLPYDVVSQRDNSWLLSQLDPAIPQNGILINSGNRFALVAKEKIFKVFNGIFIFNKNNEVQHYDKRRLVPFGEYVPLQKFFPFLNSITGGSNGFNIGSGSQTFSTEKFSFNPLLCYEAIFSDEVINKNNRPDLFINLANDSWFGNSSEPYQHFDMAIMRSVEYGVSLARSTNSGITAFIDPFGRIISKIDMGEEGIIDVDLVKNPTPTIYATYRHLPLILLVTTIFILLLISPRKKYDTRQNHTH